jgi:UPF0042 nucleotide-binding protein
MTDDSAGLVERSDAQSPKVVIVTGYSGSGKSTAANALEDLGFFVIDNLPIPLLPKVLELAATSESRQQHNFAFVVDTREREFLDRAGETIRQLHDEGARVDVVFLEADDETLIRRYSETRRPHPLGGEGTVRDGIARERELLAVLRQNADWIIETTQHTPHTLKALVKERFGEQGDPSLRITLLTFGFKHGVPPESDLVFDVRFLGNPYFVEELRDLSGLDADVRDFVLGQQETGGFLSLFRQISDFLLPLYEREGKAYLTISIGCTGGQHRSVAVAEAISSRLRGQGWEVTVRHRDARISD